MHTSLKIEPVEKLKLKKCDIANLPLNPVYNEMQYSQRWCLLFIVVLWNKRYLLIPSKGLKMVETNIIQIKGIHMVHLLRKKITPFYIRTARCIQQCKL